MADVGKMRLTISAFERELGKLPEEPRRQMCKVLASLYHEVGAEYARMAEAPAVFKETGERRRGRKPASTGNGLTAVESRELAAGAATGE